MEAITWHFVVNKDEWDTKECRGKSMKNALHVQRYGKRHLLGWSDVEQQKNQARSQVALAIVELRKSESVSGRSEDFFGWFYLTNTATS